MPNVIRNKKYFGVPVITLPVIAAWDYDNGDNFYNINQTVGAYKYSVSDNGGSPIIEYGLVIGESSTPTYENDQRIDTIGELIGIDTATFGDSRSGETQTLHLDAGTTYYVRPYAKNNAGLIGYGISRIVLCMYPNATRSALNTIYTTEIISTQTWIKMNCASEKDSSGNNITYYHPNNSATNDDAYGLLYDWATANTLAPTGWHLPSKTEYETLVTYLGGASVAGGKLKESGLSYWESPNDVDPDYTNTNARFYGRGAGKYFSGIGYNEFKTNLDMWTTTESAPFAYVARLSKSIIFSTTTYPKTVACPVRLIKD